MLVTTLISDANLPQVDEERLRQIALVSPNINVRRVSDLAYAERKGDLASKAKLDALLAEAEVIYGNGFPRNLMARAPKLKWIQTTSAGVDHFLSTDIGQSPVILTSASGIHATAIGEFVLDLMLMFAKQAPLRFRLKEKHEWKRFTPAVLNSKTVGIVGLGNIGREIARLAQAFGMRVIATRRSAKHVTRARHVDVLLPPEQLRRLLSESDFVVLIVPLTSETESLIGEEELRTMKPTAYLINVARGKIVDEGALIRALDENWIAGAGLDVFATEPLPTDSRLWDFPNVIFSPHIAGWMETYDMQAVELFCENLRRYLSGEKLLNVVDKKKGY